ncbi:MAG: branched-chain amino acid aminotransferase [Rhodospirillales bacterium]|nr:MAG: branched-chain amino acid aminotransferase [Rhodospirillales bacterium]
MGKAGWDGASRQTFVDGRWHDGSPAVLAADSHAVWLGSAVFDGARAFDGVCPDLARHAARVVASATTLGLDPCVDAATIEALAREGIARFPAGTPLYVCPMFVAESGFLVPEAASTRFVLTLRVSPLPEPTGFSACISPFRRPARDMAPTDAKAACLYPNIARAVADARARGFDSAIVLDPAANVAEFAFTNLFFASDGVVHTPAPNGTFLDGITRQRVIALLRSAGITVEERAVNLVEVISAEEVFATGNYAKVQPCTRLETRALQPGPIYRLARRLYFDWARAEGG